MATITSNIHGVKAIRFQAKVFPDFVTNQITFELEDGSTLELSGFAPEVLQVEVLDTQIARV